VILIDYDIMDIGGVPANEACAPINPYYDHSASNLLECKAYIAALKRVYGEPPDSANFRIRANSHDFGTYREVTLRYNPECILACDYAKAVENGLAHWRDARMSAPAHYDPQDAMRNPPLFIAKSVEDCFWPNEAAAAEAKAAE
jgi:hypothetical protein